MSTRGSIHFDPPARTGQARRIQHRPFLLRVQPTVAVDVDLAVPANRFGDPAGDAPPRRVQQFVPMLGQTQHITCQLGVASHAR